MKRTATILMVLALMMASVLPAMAASPVTARPGEALFHLNIDFEGNLIFSKYDVDVYLNNTLVATMEHGAGLDETFAVPRGTLSIALAESGSDRHQVVSVIGVEGETSCSFGISTHWYGIDTTDFVTSATDKLAPLGVGDTIHMGGVGYTLVDVRESAGNSTDSPMKGHVYVLCDFECENFEGGAYIIPELFAYECDGYSCSHNGSAAEAFGVELRGDIVEGNKRQGSLCLEVPADWKKITIHIGEMVSFVVCAE